MQNSSKSPQQLAAEMQQMYRNVFGTMEGRMVLGHILTQGHFGDELISVNDMAENNFAVTIARMAGAFDPLWMNLGLVPKEK